MMKRFILPTLLFLLSASAFAQTANDVLRYSFLQPGGTARSLGAGGAFGALGADYSVLSTNPAGLAMFRTSELVITPSLRFSSSDARLPGLGNQTLDEQKSNFGFDNVGMVFNSNPKTGHWKTANFAIGMNRQNNFSQSSFYQGNANGTIMNGFFDDANAVFNNGGTQDDLDPFGSRLAWDANALYDDADGFLTYDFAGNENAALQRTQTINTFGRMNEMVLSFAGNYEEKLMVGATVGVPFVNYRQEGEYKETDITEQVDFFDDLTYTEYLRTTGVGVNLKLGVNYKVSQMLRLGAAFHTPTLLSLTDNFSNTFQYTYTDGTGKNVGDIIESPDGTFDYRLRTPWRAIASGAFLFKKYGFLSADVEFVDYSANNYNLTRDLSSADNELFERELNQDIQRLYRQTMNIRIGGEFAYEKLRLRAGVNMLGKPQASDDGYNMAYTAGIGVRGETFYLDIGYRRYKSSGTIQPYSGAPIASTDNVANDILLTVGFKF